MSPAFACFRCLFGGDVSWDRPHWLVWSAQDRRKLTPFLSRTVDPFRRASREVAGTFREIDKIVTTGDMEGQ